MALLIKNGEIVTADARYRADIWCEGETITRIDSDLTAGPGDEVIDAAGKLVFPGFIDPHVHIYLPFMGTLAKDTYRNRQPRGAGRRHHDADRDGVPGPQRRPLEAYELWKSKADGQSACDYAFHMGVTQFDAFDAGAARADRRRRHGLVQGRSWPTRGALGIDDSELFETLQLARRLGVIVSAHCENAELVAELQERLLGRGQDGARVARAVAAHERRRPKGVHHLATFAELTGAHVYVVHTSCSDALDAARRGTAARRASCGSKR